MSIDLSTSFVDHVVGGIQVIIPRIPIVLFDLALGIIIIRMAHRVVRLILKSTGVQPGLRYVLTSLVETTLWLILVVVLLDEIGLGSAIFLIPGSLAVLGIAMAAGGSTLISDITAGLFLAQDRDFNVGDEIAVINDRPVMGVIESMDARRTRLRDQEGLLHVIPNSIIERKEWLVLRKRHEATALVKATNAAKHLTAVALEKKAAAVRKARSNGKNAQ